MKRFTLSIVLAFSLLSLALSALAGDVVNPKPIAPNVNVSEDWLVSVEWQNPPIVGDFTMNVSINDRTWPLQGTVVTSHSHTGSIVVDRRPLSAEWDYSGVAFYSTTSMNRSHMVGIMYNTSGNYGDFTASLISPSMAAQLSEDAGAALGQ